MSSDFLAKELAHIEHILETVPFSPSGESKTYFLDVYRLTYPEIKNMNLTEASWEQHRQVAVNRLLKLAISFGNLLKSLTIEQAAYEARAAQQRNMKRNTKASVDPFSDSYKEKVPPVALYYINFTRNLLLILKNFDIGTPSSSHHHHRPLRNSVVDNDAHSTNGLQSSSGNAVPSLPIRLNSRQLLIEKLEINIKLDALFTLKIVLKLLLNIYAVLKQLLDTKPAEEVGEVATVKAYSETSSIFSSASGGSGGPEPITSIEDYVRLIREIVHRITSGIIDPFTNLLLTEIVEPRVVNGFQNLVSTM